MFQLFQQAFETFIYECQYGNNLLQVTFVHQEMQVKHTTQSLAEKKEKEKINLFRCTLAQK